MRNWLIAAILLSTVSCVTLDCGNTEVKMNFTDTLSAEFKEVFDITWDAQFITDWNGKMLAANPRCRQMFRISEDKGLPATFLEMLDIPQREQHEFLLMVQRVFTEKLRHRPFLVQVGYKDIDGHALPFQPNTFIYQLRSTRPQSLLFSIPLADQCREDLGPQGR